MDTPVETKPVLATRSISKCSTVASEDIEMAPEVDFPTALQQLDAEFEGAANPTNPATFHAFLGCNPAIANKGQPGPVRTRSLDMPEAVMELDGEFLQ
jgi:hypothetical protein